MSNKTTIGVIIALIIIVAGYFYLRPALSRTGSSVEDLTTDLDPYNSAYIIDGGRILLEDGEAEYELAPGSSAKGRLSIVGDPVSGDLNFDGMTDSTVILSSETGGSGTFYYLGASIADSDSEAEPVSATALIGDRIIPGEVTISNGIISVTYADRASDGAMSAPPTMQKTKLFMARGGELVDMTPADARSALLSGMLMIDGEKRSFISCGETEARWVLGESPAWASILASYKALNVEIPGTPVFVVISAREMGSPTAGLGQSYRRSYYVESFGVLSAMQTCSNGITETTEGADPR